MIPQSGISRWFVKVSSRDPIDPDASFRVFELEIRSIGVKTLKVFQYRPYVLFYVFCVASYLQLDAVSRVLTIDLWYLKSVECHPVLDYG